MVRKLLISVSLITLSVVFSQFFSITRLSAQDVYVGTAPSGRRCYIVTETIQWSDRYNFSFTAKAINSTLDVIKLKYDFELFRNGAYFIDSYGGEGEVYFSNDNGNPIEFAFCQYVLKNSDRP